MKIYKCTCGAITEKSNRESCPINSAPIGSIAELRDGKYAVKNDELGTSCDLLTEFETLFIKTFLENQNDL